MFIDVEYCLCEPNGATCMTPLGAMHEKHPLNNLMPVELQGYFRNQNEALCRDQCLWQNRPPKVQKNLWSYRLTARSVFPFLPQHNSSIFSWVMVYSYGNLTRGRGRGCTTSEWSLQTGGAIVRVKIRLIVKAVCVRILCEFKCLDTD